MKHNNPKQMWQRAICLLLLFTFLMPAMIRAEPATQTDLDDDEQWWDGIDGIVILDDPALFMDFDDEDEMSEVQDETPNAEESTMDTPADEAPDASADPETSAPDEPGDESSDASVDEPAADTTEKPQPTEAPANPKTLFDVEIKVPTVWYNSSSKDARIKITPTGNAMWDKVEYRMGNDNWTRVKDKFLEKDGYYYVDVELNVNGTLTVRLFDKYEQYFDTKKTIAIFDYTAPVITAGILDKKLKVECSDDASGTAGVQVNGLLFTTLENGILLVDMQPQLLTYKQLAIRAYDYAGNFSDVVTLDNPYYAAPTATPTAKPTKKPTSSGSDAAIDPTKKPAATLAPTAAPVLQQEPTVIIVTAPPAQPTAEPVKETVYVPLGPGQPFTNSGNMNTLDMLYSAATNKQFITVQSRAGQTYYLVIDYDKPIDEENNIYETYFLNLVDDRDLMSVLDASEIIATPTPQIVYVTPEPTRVPLIPPTVDKKDNSMPMMALMIAMVAGIGSAVWYFIRKKDAKKPQTYTEYDDDEEELENEEESEEAE